MTHPACQHPPGLIDSIVEQIPPPWDKLVRVALESQPTWLDWAIMVDRGDTIEVQWYETRYGCHRYVAHMAIHGDLDPYIELHVASLARAYVDAQVAAEMASVTWEPGP